jgi:ABC-type uncharacterized transport system permease subunit
VDLRRFAFIALVIIILFTIVLLIGGAQVAPMIIITSMVATTISVATPLTLGALSGVFCERSGVVNIGIEGMMLTAAFFGWFGSIYMNTILNLPAILSLLIGLVIAILSGALMGLLHAVLSITFKVDQIIGGTVINILAVGITGFLNRQLFFEKGSVFGGQIPHAPGTFRGLKLPHFSDDPAVLTYFSKNQVAFYILMATLAVILLVVLVLLIIVLIRILRIYRNKETRPQLTEASPRNLTFRYVIYLLYGVLVGWLLEQQPIAISAILLVIVANFVLFNTRWGLRTRAVGEHPRAADTVGINVYKMRYANVIIGGCLAGLAGAYFTLESVPSFEPLMTNGRGFISLAAMIFGNWTPFGAWAAALVFGAAQALQINVQFFREWIPPNWAFIQQAYVVGMIPYILTMLILTGVIGRTTAPAADGSPYEK